MLLALSSCASCNPTVDNPKVNPPPKAIINKAQAAKAVKQCVTETNNLPLEFTNAWY